jgi:hypothetical protein
MSKGTRKLSGSERLQIANHRSGRVAVGRGGVSLVGKLLGLLVPNLLVPNPAQPDEQRIQAYRRQALRALARNSFERVAAGLISPTELLSLDNPSAQRFLFRCFFVPQFAALECSISTKLNSDPNDRLPPWWLFEPASYVLAFERTFLEMALTRPGVQLKGQPWKAPATARSPVDLPKPSWEFFLDASSTEAARWEARFDEWRTAALQSFRYYMSLLSADIDTHDSRGAAVSLWGTIEHETPLPKELLAGIREQLRRGERRFLHLFYGSAAKRQPYGRAMEADLDTWLIEIHPLATRYAWRHADLVRIGQQKFQRDTKGLTSPATLRSHMRRLNLKLSPRGSRRGRRPKTRRRNRLFLAPMEWLAAFLDSTGGLGRSWLLGQLGLCKP